MKRSDLRGLHQNPLVRARVKSGLPAGSCGFVCQSSYSCVTGVGTNTNFGKRLLEFPGEAAAGEAADDKGSALAQE